MKIEQIYTGCLAQGAYYIESNGEVAIIDPLREVDSYIEKAHSQGAQIKYIFETHFHADFVSGHITLSEKTGAPIVFGPEAEPMFEAIIASDGQEFKLGNISIKAIHTPGHTLESTTYLLKNEAGEDYAIFTGDTLFIGDVGRPDLAQKKLGISKEELAGILYDTLREKIFPLSDDLIVYPAHGAGSACGKNMSKETYDSLGNQKKTNYALDVNLSKENFIKELTHDLGTPPAYFPDNVRLNREGYTHIDEILSGSLKLLSASHFMQLAEEAKALVLDVRKPHEYAAQHIPRSIFIGLDGGFAPWVGALIKDVNQQIIVVAPEGREEEAITRLARVGFDNVLGFLQGGIGSWQNMGFETDSVISIPAEKFALENTDVEIFDVRKDGEYASSHIVGAKHAPLDEINIYLNEFPKIETFFIHCQGGYRSMIAASILKSRGIHNFIDIGGGVNALKLTNIKLTDEVCSTTMEKK